MDHCLTFKIGVPVGLLGVQGPICSLFSNCDVLRHSIFVIGSREAAVPLVLRPSCTRAGKEWEAMWNEQLAASLSWKTSLNNQGEKISIFWEEQVLNMSVSKIIVLYYIF